MRLFLQLMIRDPSDKCLTTHHCKLNVQRRPFAVERSLNEQNDGSCHSLGQLVGPNGVAL